MLLNVLPARVAEDLKRHGKAEPESASGEDFDRCLAMIRDRLTKKAYPIQLPVGTTQALGFIVASPTRAKSNVSPGDPATELRHGLDREARFAELQVLGGYKHLPGLIC